MVDTRGHGIYGHFMRCILHVSSSMPSRCALAAFAALAHASLEFSPSLHFSSQFALGIRSHVFPDVSIVHELFRFRFSVVIRQRFRRVRRLPRVTR